MIISLEYLWWGVSIGGRHYTGEIRFNGKKIELERKLSSKEAKTMAEEQGRLWLSRERITNKFDSLPQLERAAIKWCRQNLKDPWLLQAYSTINPERPIFGTGFYKSRIPALRKLHKMWDKVPDSQREDEIWNTVYKAFNLLITPP